MTSFDAPVRAERLLDSLTDEQRAVVESPSPRLRVLAAAGSGKTRVLAARVVHLIRFRGVAPTAIRVFVFTRAAAFELRSRVASVLGGEVAESVDVTTFHGYAARLASAHLEVGEIATEELSEAALRSLYEGPMRRLRGDVPGIEAVRAALVDHEAGKSVEPKAMKAVRLVEARVEATGAAPLWTLLPRASQLLEDHAVAAEEAVDCLLVDEAQDVTPRESALVRRLADAADADVLAVGDPRQAIMGFRGAEPAALDWIAGEALTLSRSFRFGATIAAEANRLFPELPAVEGGGPEGSIVAAQDRQDFIETVHLALQRTRDAAVLCTTHEVCEEVARDLGAGFRYVGRHYAGDQFAEAKAQGVVPVTTVHAAKGREFDVVAIPPERRREDDRAVRYVALTRAKTRLIVGEAS